MPSINHVLGRVNLQKITYYDESCSVEMGPRGRMKGNRFAQSSVGMCSEVSASPSKKAQLERESRRCHGTEYSAERTDEPAPEQALRRSTLNKHREMAVWCAGPAPQIHHPRTRWSPRGVCTRCTTEYSRERSRVPRPAELPCSWGGTVKEMPRARV
jgi:hypothetical protein